MALSISGRAAAHVQGRPLICEPRPSFGNQPWGDAHIRKSGNQNNKNTKTQLRSKLVWFIGQWKAVGWLGLERLRGGSHNAQIGPSVHPATRDQRFAQRTRSRPARELKNCSAILVELLLENDLLM
jgi:hypothetical protein